MASDNFSKLFEQVGVFYRTAQLTKTAYIKKMPNGKYRVFSEKGKNLGTYPSHDQAKKRLRQIEFFKHKKASDNSLDLSKLEDVGYSAIVRELNKNGDQEMILDFLNIYKKCFDHAVLNNENEEKVLPKTLMIFGKKYKLHLPKK